MRFEISVYICSIKRKNQTQMKNSEVKDVNGVELKKGQVVQFGHDLDREKTKGVIDFIHGCYGVKVGVDFTTLYTLHCRAGVKIEVINSL